MIAQQVVRPNVEGGSTRGIERGRIANVEAGRGIAALLVVFFHLTKYYFGVSKYWTAPAFGGFFLFGHAGVEFFFVLSGFIMVWVHRRDIGKPGRLGAFAWKRFQRIYPFFWLVLTVTLLLDWWFPLLGQPFYRNPTVILQSAALAGVDPLRAVVFVSWTLWHEVVFYAVCAAAIAWPRFGVAVFLFWTVACASMTLPSYVFGFINVLFSMGAGVALALQRWSFRRPLLLVTGGLFAFLLTAVTVDCTDMLSEWLSNLLFGSGSALALVGAVELERSGRFSAPTYMRVLGASSFSIYLTHILTLTFLAKASLFLNLPHRLPWFIAFAGLASAAVLSGVAVHFLIERPLLAACSSLRTALLAGRSPTAPLTQPLGQPPIDKLSRAPEH